MKRKFNINKLLFWIFLILNKKLLFKLQYFHHRGRFPDFKNPKDISELILSELLEPKYILRYSKYADKISVRQYVKEKGLEEILLKHYGVWDDANKIDFSKLPDKFVLKTNNGSAGHIFCREKSTLDEESCIKRLNKKLHLSYAYNREPHYKEISPLIFCEELIDTGSDSLPTDYKFTCIKGKPFEILVCTDRNKNIKFSTFDMNWNVLNYIKKKYLPGTYPEKPKNLNRMIEIAKILSEDFNFVRVDLYDAGERIFFGELTFSPAGGLMHPYTDEAILRMGELYRD
ncbi:MAG: hypothetical protein JXB17_13970 [Bacteroidales bacterium]|nr:hypothetical protein [Bacteroidales bacterium]